MSARARRSALRQLLSGGQASTQAELCALLSAQGHEVTQSTVSRDLKRLGATRAIAGDGTPVYRLGAPPPPSLAHGTVLSIAHNEAMVVLRTRAGLAQAVGLEIDALGRADVLGTLAGDDAVLVVPRAITEVETLVRALREMAGLSPPTPDHASS